jgi:hypothetical protein
MMPPKQSTALIEYCARRFNPWSRFYRPLQQIAALQTFSREGLAVVLIEMIARAPASR